jgi:hypothetical protein
MSLFSTGSKTSWHFISSRLISSTRLLRRDRQQNCIIGLDRIPQPAKAAFVECFSRPQATQVSVPIGSPTVTSKNCLARHLKTGRIPLSNQPSPSHPIPSHPIPSLLLLHQQHLPSSPHNAKPVYDTAILKPQTHAFEPPSYPITR